MNDARVAEFMKALSSMDADPASGGAQSEEAVMKQLSMFAQLLEQAAPPAATAAAAASTSASSSTSASTVPSTTVSSSRPSSTVTSATSAASTYSSSIDQAVRAISAGASSLPGGTASSALPSLDPSMDALLNSLMADFASSSSSGPSASGSASGSSPSMDALIDKLMTQMLSREYLYQPMKDIAAAYPAWLTEQSTRLTADQRRQYELQQGCFERIVAVYERKDGGGSEEAQGKEVMDIMQEMQRYGQPPKELVNDLLPPGLLGEDGVAGAGGGSGGGGTGGMSGLEGLDKGMLDEMSKNGCPMQ